MNLMRMMELVLLGASLSEDQITEGRGCPFIWQKQGAESELRVYTG